MSKKISAISSEAQWFEDNSTIMDVHKKKNVVGYNEIKKWQGPVSYTHLRAHETDS